MGFAGGRGTIETVRILTFTLYRNKIEERTPDSVRKGKIVL